MWRLRSLEFKRKYTWQYLSIQALTALGCALAIQAIGQQLSHQPVNSQLITVTSPKHLVAGERYAALAGFHLSTPGSYQTQIRACRENRNCTLIWPRALDVTEANLDVWTVVGGQFRLAEAGSHTLEAFVKRQWGHEGYRSIGRYSWSVTVE